MALPILETPKHNTVLPSSQRTVYFRPFLVGEQKVLLMAQESEDQNQQISEMIRLINVCSDDMEAQSLATIDLEYLFLQIRIKSVGETSDVQMICTSCNQDNKVTVHLDKATVEEPKEIIDNIVEITPTISLDLRHPSYEIVNKVDLNNSEDPKVIFDVVAQCINTIIDGDEIHTRDDFTDKELMSFLDTMSLEMFENVQKFFVNTKTLQITGTYDCEHCKETSPYELVGLGNFFG
tara:strand:+ start:648 stop:1355 length:708 start_codon:yes stop_codon:yes gene_type:complete